jgi:hypothetical protein
MHRAGRSRSAYDGPTAGRRRDVPTRDTQPRPDSLVSLEDEGADIHFVAR